MIDENHYIYPVDELIIQNFSEGSPRFSKDFVTGTKFLSNSYLISLTEGSFYQYKLSLYPQFKDKDFISKIVNQAFKSKFGFKRDDDEKIGQLILIDSNTLFSLHHFENFEIDISIHDTTIFVHISLTYEKTFSVKDFSSHMMLIQLLFQKSMSFLPLRTNEYLYFYPKTFSVIQNTTLCVSTVFSISFLIYSLNNASTASSKPNSDFPIRLVINQREVISRKETAFDLLKSGIQFPHRRFAIQESLKTINLFTIHTHDPIKITPISYIWSLGQQEITVNYFDQKLSLYDYYKSYYGITLSDQDIIITASENQADINGVNLYPSSLLRPIGLLEAEKNDTEMMKVINAYLVPNPASSLCKQHDLVYQLLEVISRFHFPIHLEQYPNRPISGVLSPPTFFIDEEVECNLSMLQLFFGHCGFIPSNLLYTPFFICSKHLQHLFESEFWPSFLYSISSMKQTFSNPAITYISNFSFFSVQEELCNRIKSFGCPSFLLIIGNCPKKAIYAMTIKLGIVSHIITEDEFLSIRIQNNKCRINEIIKNYKKQNHDLKIPKGKYISNISSNETIKKNKYIDNINLHDDISNYSIDFHSNIEIDEEKVSKKSRIETISSTIYAKLGGLPFLLSPSSLPLQNTMFIGLTLHSASATFDRSYMRFFSKYDLKMPNNFKHFILDSIEIYQKNHEDNYPSRIIIYADSNIDENIVSTELISLNDLLNDASILAIKVQEKTKICLFSTPDGKQWAPPGTFGFFQSSNFFLKPTIFKNILYYSIFLQKPIAWTDDQIVRITYALHFTMPHKIGPLLLPAPLAVAQKLMKFIEDKFIDPESIHTSLSQFLYFIK